MMRIILALQLAVLLFFLFFFLGGPSPLSAQELKPPSSTPGLEPSGPTPVVESAADTSTSQVSAEMMEMVVTASRLDRPASQVPNSMTVLTAKEMENKQSGTVNGALQEVPGLDTVRAGGPGESTSLYMRGGGDGDTLVLMDGIPLNDPLSTSRAYDYLDGLPLNGVQRIEVLRGAQSVLYGSNAMAGVVNIITGEGAGPAGGSVLFEGGSYGTWREQASAQGGDARGYYALAASYFNTAGFPSAEKAFGNSLNNPFSDFSSLLRLGAAPASNVREELLVSYNQSRLNLDDGAGSGSLPMPVMDDANNWSDQKQVLVGSRTHWTLGDWEQVLTLSLGDNDRYYSDSADPLYPYSADSASRFDGQTGQITWQNNWRVEPGKTLVFGLQGYREWGDGSSLYSGIPSPSTQASQWAESAFLEVQASQDERLFLNGGARVDDYNTYGAHGTYQVGAAYFIPGLETKLKATYGTGFLAPSLYQLHAPPPTGNPGLQPETSAGYDFGLEQSLAGSALKVGATYFHNGFENLILYVGSYPTGRYQNSSSFQTRGVESFVDLKIAEVLTVRGSYTYTDVQTSIPASQPNSPLLQKPAHRAQLDLDYQAGPLEAEVSTSYVAQRADFDFWSFSPVTLGDYFRVNLRASYQVDSHVKVFARVDNLFNQFYEEIYGYGTPGLSGYVGTKVSF